MQLSTLRLDSKGRITLGALAKGVTSYRAHQDADGRLILEPYVEIPMRELWLHQTPDALHKLQQGIKQAEAGELTSLGDFSAYATDA